MTKPGRNDDCPCGSGKKYKHCCLAADESGGDRSSKAGTAADDDFRQALEHFQAGRLIEAEAICTRVLETQPNRPEVIHLLGIIALQAGMPDVAVDLLIGAIDLAPQVPEAYYNLGNAFRELGKLVEAETSYRQAVSLKPDYVMALGNLGDVLRRQGRVADAADVFRQASRVSPQSAGLRLDLAELSQAMGDLIGAEAGYRQAIVLDDQCADAYCKLGVLLQGSRRFTEAANCFLKAIGINPQHYAAYCGYGMDLLQQRQLVEAVACFQQAIAIDRQGAIGYFGLGTAMCELKWFDQAIEPLQTAVNLAPDAADWYGTLSKALTTLGRVDEAEACCREALRLRPQSASIHSHLADALFEQGRLTESQQLQRHAVELEPDNPAHYSTFLFRAQYQGDITPAELFLESRRFAEHFEPRLVGFGLGHDHSRDPEKRLKIGYVSGDFRNHAIAFFIEPILLGHDRSGFEVYCYHNHFDSDRYTESLKSHSDHWLPCAGMTDDELARRIVEDGIDILVDLSGHTEFNRMLVFARKPAPVQVTLMGMLGTTGLRAIDYRISDQYLTPPGEFDAYHTEKLFLLPNTGYAFKGAAESPPVNRLPALVTGRLVFACLNNLIKINDPTLRLWLRLLAEFSGARLMLGNVTTPQVEKHLRQRLAAAGISDEQVILNPKLPLKEYLALHHQIDLTLDPYPYSGSTTSLHSLWMGVPVLALAGPHLASRSGVAALARVGLHNFITSSEDEYINRAVEVCGNLDGLNDIRQSLRQRMSGVDSSCDGVTRDLETAYRTMWRTWCSS